MLVATLVFLSIPKLNLQPRVNRSFPLIFNYRSQAGKNFRLLVDSGSPESFLDFTAVKQTFQSSPAQEIKPNAVVMQSEIALLEALSVQSEGFVVLNEDWFTGLVKELRIDGVLGRGVLEKVVVGVDFDQHFAKVWDNKDKVRPWERWLRSQPSLSAISIGLSGSTADGYFLGASAGHAKILMQFDTGASTSTLPSTFASRIPYKFLWNSKTSTQDGTFDRKVVFLPTLRVSPMEICSPVVTINTEGDKAVLALDSLPFDRCYIDLQSKVIVGCATSASHVALSSTLSRILGVSVFHQAGVFFVRDLELKDKDGKHLEYQLAKIQDLDFSKTFGPDSVKDQSKLFESLAALRDIRKTCSTVSVKRKGELLEAILPN